MQGTVDDVPTDVLTADKPAATVDDAVALAARVYGLDVTARMLSSERDANFHLATRDGRDFVLKVVNAAEPAGVSAMQTLAFRHIVARDPALPVSRLCPTLAGADDLRTTLAGTSHVVRLVSYLQGEPLHLSRPSLEQAAAIGRCLAGLDRALSDFHHPAAGHDLLWDLKRAPKLRALLPCIADPRLRALATVGLDRYEHAIAPRAEAFRTQVIHNDFNPHNVLVDPKNPDRVTGVLDFGDMVEAALVNDVAIAAAYQVEGDDPLARPVALVGAYHDQNALRPAEVEALFDLITLRHVLSVTITAWRASLHPENTAYIMRNQPRAAAALESLDLIGREAAGRRFRHACGMG